jgi:glycosyltransferase involved in cell wall biosynthesis
MSVLISIVAPFYNEEESIEEFYSRVTKSIESYKKYEFEFIFIDNASEDNTAQKLKELAASDYRVKLILNTRNFGHIRSPAHALRQASGEAVLLIHSDLQEPPECIPSLIDLWEEGAMVVLCTKPASKTNQFAHVVRKIYYRVTQKLSDVSLINDANGFGIYDKVVVKIIREFNDPYPYFPGLIAEIGHSVVTLEYVQEKRKYGNTKNNYYTLLDYVLLGITSYSIIPIRTMTIFGFSLSLVSFVSGLAYLIAKIVNWNAFPMGIVPLILINLFCFGILFIFLGILGEYIISIITYIKKRPLVIEKERINFK